MYCPLGKPKSNLNGWDNISDFSALMPIICIFCPRFS